MFLKYINKVAEAMSNQFTGKPWDDAFVTYLKESDLDSVGGNGIDPQDSLATATLKSGENSVNELGGLYGDLDGDDDLEDVTIRIAI